MVELQEELARSVGWAKDREVEAEVRAQRVVELQVELAQATAWAKQRDAEAEERGHRIVEVQAGVRGVERGLRGRD